ncbi:MAG: aminopeptidase [Gemmatimonadota bacterium]|nr:MAG: aminopeptidase [Gemmatimonadota bacterium]
MRRPARTLWIRALLLAVLAGGALATACSPIYVIKAALAEAKILRARRPLPEVILDPETDEVVRGKLTLVREARRYAVDVLELDVGDSYTSFSQLEKDTLALVLSAAHRDRLASKTWWFPVVGSVPYRAFFDLGDAREEQLKLEAEGFDTYLRPTGAFSTLGWFADPLVSSVLRADEVDVVETVLHELSHNHLFVSGQVRFNESFASFVGRAAAAEFFCSREGGQTDTAWCQRAKARWEDDQAFSRFLDAFVGEIESFYASDSLDYESKVAGREEIFLRYRKIFAEEVQPTFQVSTFQYFLSLPLNNAIILARMRYHHRLTDFQMLLEEKGSLKEAIRYLAVEARRADDPFDLLPSTAVAATARQTAGARD